MPRLTRERQYGRLLTEIAMNVRMAISGNLDFYDELSDDIELLKDAKTHWEYGLSTFSKVDNAILNLIICVLDEIERDNGMWIKNLK